MNERNLLRLSFGLACAAMLWASGIIPAVIPQSAPAANKRGNSTVFALAANNTPAAAGSLYCDDGNGNTTTSGCGSTGSTVASTAFASLPGTCTAGNLYLFTDSAYTQALCGASNVYKYWTGDGLATPPPLTSWTGDNMGTATAAASTGMWRIANAATAAATQMQVQYRAVPSSAYTLDVQILPETGQQTGCTGVQSTGIGVRDSGGKYITLLMGSGFTTTTGLNYMFTGKWNSATSRSSAPDSFGNVAQNTTLKFQSPYFIRMVVDATNITFSTSYNRGANYTQFAVVPWGGFLADITSNSFETSNECANVVASSLVSWLEH